MLLGESQARRLGEWLQTQTKLLSRWPAARLLPRGLILTVGSPALEDVLNSGLEAVAGWVTGHGVKRRRRTEFEQAPHLSPSREAGTPNM